MELKHFPSVDAVAFNSDQVKGVSGRVLIGKEDGAGHFCMRLFEIEPGGYTPRHSHAWEHEMFVHQGEGEVLGNGAYNPVRPGSVVFMPGGEEHQIRNTGATPLVVVCLVPSFAPEI